MPSITNSRLLPIEEVRPYPGNPRRHPRKQTKKLAKAIERFGFTTAIALDDDMVILAGHGRLEAAKLLGLTEIPVVIVSGLSDQEKTALRTSDNRLADESDFDRDLLRIELKGLLEVNFDLELTGLDAIELDPILTPHISNHVEADDLPEPPSKPVARTGDLWKLDEHLILCGDATDPASYDRLLQGSKATMVFTDPPWNVKIKGHVSGLGKAQHDEFAMASGEMSDGEFKAFLRTCADQLHQYTLDGSILYICMDWRGISDLIAVGREVFDLLNLAVWVKPNGGMGSFYRSQHELIAIFKKGGASHINNVQLGRLGRYRSNVWQYPGGSSFSKSRAQDLQDHPTVKPLQMVVDVIQDASKPGDLILDPFGGAGTTLMASQKAGRRAALIEIEPKFVDVTFRRFTDDTGVEPLLLPDRRPLSSVSAERRVGWS